VRYSKTLIAVVAVLALTVNSALVARADSPGIQTLSILAEVTNAAKTRSTAVLDSVAKVRTSKSGSDAISATIRGVELGIPVDPSRPIRIASGGRDVALSLPLADASSNVSVLAPGVVSYVASGLTSAVVVKSDGSLQIASVLGADSSPSRLRYELTSHGGRLVAAADGSVQLVDSGVVIAELGNPWARDADGRPVPTHYVVAGDSVVQVIDHKGSGFAYPIVADPLLKWFPWGYAIKFTKAETKRIAATASDSAALSVMCGLIASAPGAVACGLAGLIVTRVSTSYVRGIVARKHCLQINYAWALPPLYYEVTC
jgi:hypothetical protein